MSSIPTNSVPARMSYWLVPAEASLFEYQAIVSQLAFRFNGPDFVPHVTVYFGPFDTRDSIGSNLKSLSRFGQVELTSESLQFTDQFTQSCFIRFENSTVLTEMCEVVRQAVHSPAPYQVAPHMSLFYGNLSHRDRAIIQREIPLPKKMRFSVVSAIANPPQVACRADVEYWHEVGRLQLD
jgi:hypothetical protein